MRYLLTALVLAAPLASGAAPANVCDVSDIIDCEALAKAPVDLSGTQGFPRFRDGRQIFNTIAAFEKKDSPKFLKSQEPTPKQLIDLDKNIDRIRKRIREFLKSGRSDSWIQKSQEPEAAELRAILKRLDSVKIRIAKDEDSECSEVSPLGFPNAFNHLARNTIAVCPALAKQSLPWLTRTIAHEIGHVLGPCAMEKPLFIAKPDSDLAASSCFDTGEDSENSSGNKDIDRLVTSIKSGEVTSIVENRSLVAEVVSCGMFEEAPEASVPREKRSIFGQTSQCIDLAHASGFEEELKKGINQDLIIGAMDSKTAESRWRTANPQACYMRSVEHFADSFAARFTSHVAEEDNWNKNDLRTSMIDDAIAVCAAQANRYHLHPDRYPSAATRLSVALNEAVVRDRLKCVAEPNAERLCSLPPSTQGTQQPGAKPSNSSRATQ